MTTTPAAGHTRWFVPDCYLPADDPAKGDLASHESCCILNVGPEEANCRLSFYFEDRDPVSDVSVTVPAERCIHVRFDRLESISGFSIPRDVPYGLAVHSDAKIVVQHSRLDTRGGGLAYMTAMGYSED
jgi:hypothetical protein